jgi:LPS export ABC transporter protein LptC
MSKRNSLILGLLFVILVVELIILAPKEIGSPSETVAPSPPAASDKASAQIMNGVYSVESKGNGKEWELWAVRALQPKSNQEWTIERVKVKFYASNGVMYTVNGNQGHVVPNDKGVRDIKITGNVVTHASNGYVFKSESIFYDSEKRRLASPSDVEMISPPDKNGGEMVLTGADMLADLTTNEITVNKNVKTRKKIFNRNGPERTAQIRSDRAIFSGRSKSAQFFGHVNVNIDAMTVTGPEAKFGYDEGSESLQSVLVNGGIRVTDQDKMATSQSVNVNFKDDRIVFKGAPKVVHNGDELTGDEIIFYDGGHKVQVVNAKAQIDSKTLEKDNSPVPEKRN